ncbi:hypothetical protein PHISP_01967 [Aspergillus sp. HF37]|nr:hypothetical protein PHISP_01967 [Aspergillus sp. HF37]
MTGMAGDSTTSSEEGSDPIVPNIAPNTYGERAHESASSKAEKLMAPMQPGDTHTSARRLSDIPSNRQADDWKPDEEEQNTSKPMLQAAQETVASALGGTSCGGWVR